MIVKMFLLHRDFFQLKNNMASKKTIPKELGQYF